MAITMTILQRQFNDLQRDVIDLKRLFELFRGYTNKEFTELSDKTNMLQHGINRIDRNVEELSLRVDGLTVQLEGVVVILAKLANKLL